VTTGVQRISQIAPEERDFKGAEKELKTDHPVLEVPSMKTLLVRDSKKNGQSFSAKKVTQGEGANGK